MTPGRRRTLIAIVATVAVLAPLAWFWQASLLPSTYSVMDMGYVDDRGRRRGPVRRLMRRVTGQATAAAPVRSVDSFADATGGQADVEVTLTARKEQFRLASGRPVDGYTLNGTSPGPVIRAEQGQLVEVRLVNESVPDAVTLHWHGVDVPNAEDGTAGVTQDAVPVGGEHTYRFRVDQVGTFWYHSHQVAHEQVQRGLLGAFLITPRGGGAERAPVADELALVHIYDGQRTINGLAGDVPVTAAPGSRVRVRVINSDAGPMPVWVSGAPFRLVAVDGTDLHGPTPVTDASVEVTAGARADLEIDLPADGSGARVEMAGSAALVLGPGPVPRTPPPSHKLDLLTYGTPAPVGFDPEAATRRFEYSIGRRPGFLDGVPGLWWTINGHLFPDVPMFVVAEGDVVRMRIENHSGEVHPMHLHGHHALVLNRNGVPATGSPWWVDSLDVGDGEAYDVAFVADNPGVWMDHCHNLPHAAEGLTAHRDVRGRDDAVHGRGRARRTSRSEASGSGEDLRPAVQGKQFGTFRGDTLAPAAAPDAVAHVGHHEVAHPAQVLALAVAPRGQARTRATACASPRRPARRGSPAPAAPPGGDPWA